jgi:asparagine synthase (glutamine-hydrolysing)
MTAGTLIAGYLDSSPGALAPWTATLSATGLSSAMPLAAGPTASDVLHRGPCITARSDDGCSLMIIGAPYPKGSGPQDDAVRPAHLLDRLRDDPVRTLETLAGPFALALVDPVRREVLLAVDRFAVENLYVVSTARGIAFANRSRVLAGHPAVDNRFSTQALYESIYFHWLPGPAAGYVGMERLLPGHCASWRDGRLSTTAYWSPRFDIDRTVDNEAHCVALRDSIEQAVARRLPESSPACFLSGGLDSSTITGYSAKLRPRDTVAYTIGFEADGYDEMEFANNVASHFGVRHERYYVTPDDVIDALPSIIDEFDAPFGNASAIPTYYCAKLAAAHGHERILAGDGGDELFGGNERYAKQLTFEHYWKLPAALRHGLMEPLLGRGALGRRSGVLGKAGSYVRQASVPLPDRLMTYNLLNFVEPSSFLSADILAGIDFGAPSRTLQDMYAAPAGTDTLNRLLKLDWRVTLADSDLPKVSRMCALAGIEVVYPMLDEGVVDVSMRLPVETKVAGGVLRPLYRQAFSNFLPQATLTKSKQGFGLPFGVWLHEKPGLRAFAFDALSDLEASGVLASGFSQGFLTEKVKQHPAYFGTLAWVLIALGLWLKNSRARLA